MCELKKQVKRGVYVVLANKEEKNFSYSKKVAVRSEDVAKHGGQVARQVGLCVL